jgi:hypothetical protein
VVDETYEIADGGAAERGAEWVGELPLGRWWTGPGGVPAAAADWKPCWMPALGGGKVLGDSSLGEATA